MIPRSALALGLFLLALVPCLAGQSAHSPSSLKSAKTQDDAGAAAVPSQAASAFARYSGYRIRTVSFKNAQRIDQSELLKSIPIQAGQVLDRNNVHASLQRLFATGRFRTIAAEATPYPDRSLDLDFLVEEKLFIGSIVVYGAPRPPTANQLLNSAKLQVGQDFDEDVVAAGIERMKKVLAEDGYFAPTIRMDSSIDPPHQRIELSFIVERGQRAKVGQVIVKGDPGYPDGKIRKIAKLHPGDPVVASHSSRAFTRLHKKYQKNERLEAQVSLVDRNYHTDTNRLDYVFEINRGPIVDVRVEGAHMRRGLIKKYVPIFEEGAVDEDLLSEGRRNLRDYFQTQGYFDVKVNSTLTKKGDRELVIFDIDKGQRHTFKDLAISGNKYFPKESIRERMAIQPADALQRHGLFSSALLDHDVSVISALYQANGFQAVKVDSKVVDNYQGKSGRLQIQIIVAEGPQTRVKSVRMTGNAAFSQEDLLDPLNTIPGQPYSPYLLANDRDSLVSYYFDRGFPDVQVETTTNPSPDEPNRQDVSFKITEGRQVFVDKILISGLRYTKPFVVDREFDIKEGDAMSQSRILNTQRKLYDLSIFNQVDVAPGNPEGDVDKKNLLVQVEEAKRYTIDYGIGFQVQTGNVRSDCENVTASPTSTQVCNPGGATGFSPLVTFGVTRANFLGRNNTIVFRTNLGRLQQRALLSYVQPYWMNRKNLTLTFNALYDSTQNVLTFSSERLEGSVQVLQAWRPGQSFLYKFTYRLVKVDEATLHINPELIPLLSRPVRVGIPSISYVRDHRDDPIDSHKGSYYAADFGVASRIFGSQANYVRIFLENSTYYTFAQNKNVGGRRWTFARSTRIGVEEPFAAGSNTLAGIVPLPEKFFTGGSNSHRGYAINQGGPRDATTGFPLGGDGLFLNNLELRTPPIALPYVGDNLSAVIFHDAGNVFNSPSDIFQSLAHWTQPHRETCEPQSTQPCDFNYISQAVGLGVRYRTPIGPVRVDFGYNLTPTYFPVRDDPVRGPYLDHTGRFNFFFSIGQTF